MNTEMNTEKYFAVSEAVNQTSGRPWGRIQIFDSWEEAYEAYTRIVLAEQQRHDNTRPISDQVGNTVGMIDAADFGHDDTAILEAVRSEFPDAQQDVDFIDGDGKIVYGYTVEVEEGQPLSTEWDTWGCGIQAAEDSQPYQRIQDPKHRPNLIPWLAGKGEFEGKNPYHAWNIAAAEHISELEQDEQYED